MKSIGGYVFPVLLIIIGGVILLLALISGQNLWVKLGSFLTLATGVIALLLQVGMLSRNVSMVIGALCLISSVFLGFRNYRSVAEVIEFREAKEKNDATVVQGLKDIRTAQEKYKLVNGAYTGNLGVLQDFVRNGTYPMIRAVGQTPDSLTEKDALALGIIVRDTIRVSVLDSTFRSRKATEKRVYPFDVNGFVNSPVSGKPFLMTAGIINAGGRNAPVLLVKDPSPLVKGDTLMFGSMEKSTMAGNWKGD
ncbi:MAG: hypothetical protein IPJ85_07185 [Flavobacteriales bacterium]|nr:hypothetical protein [Flavobacteriales bacterium]